MDLNLHVAIHPSLVRWLQQQKKEEASCGEEDLAREEGRENNSRAPGDSSRKKDTRIQSRKDRFQRIFIKSHAHSHICVSQTNLHAAYYSVSCKPVCLHVHEHNASPEWMGKGDRDVFTMQICWCSASYSPAVKRDRAVVHCLPSLHNEIELPCDAGRVIRAGHT